MLPVTLIAVFCGPWRTDARFCGPEEGGRRDYDRIDAGIEYCLAHPGTALLIVGDANEGRDVREFAARAVAAGVKHVIKYHDPEGRTISDARSVARVLKSDTRLSQITHLHLVTHWWHMMRTHIFLRSALTEAIPDAQFVIDAVPVHAGPAPTVDMLLGEAKGIEHFIRGIYATSADQIVDPGLGKPVYELPREATVH